VTLGAHGMTSGAIAPFVRWLLFERSSSQLTGEAGTVAARYVLVSNLTHPRHGGALRRLGDRFDHSGEECFLEVVPGKRFNRFCDDGQRQSVELEPNHVDTGADMDEGDFRTFARGDANGRVKRNRIPLSGLTP